MPAFLFKSRYRDADVNWWTCVYEVVWDGPISHQEQEIAWGGFMPEADLIVKLDEWRFVPGVFRHSGATSMNEATEPLRGQHRSEYQPAGRVDGLSGHAADRAADDLGPGRSRARLGLQLHGRQEGGRSFSRVDREGGAQV